MGAAAVMIALPWPPSVNRIWRHVVSGGTGRTIMSKEGREYRARVAAELSGAFRGRPPRFTGPVGVMIRAYPPDERRRDLDNVLKAALDALSAAGVWDDDHRVADLRIVRMCPARDARLELAIVPQTLSQGALL